MSTNQKFQRLADSIDGFISVEQLKTLRATEWGHGTFKEFAYAIQKAASKRLHPMRGHVYPRSTWLRKENREKLQLGVKIDGLRHIAERSGEYAGQRGPFWYDEHGEKYEIWLQDAPPAAAVVEVLRHDFETTIRGIARWDDYAPYKKNGDLFHMWANMGPHMLAKCAEANAHRKAFQVGDLYIAEEMHQAEVSTPKAHEPDPQTREPADAHEKSQKQAEKVNEALGFGGDGETSSSAPGPPLDPEAATDGSRTPGQTKGEAYQKKAREAAKKRAAANGSPDRPISDKQLKRLWAIGKNEGEYSDSGLRRMVKREWGYDSLSDITRNDYDSVVEHARDPQMAGRYNRDPDTKNMFGEAPEEAPQSGPEVVVDRVLESRDVTDSERQNLLAIAHKVATGLSQFDDLPQKNVSAAGFLQKIDPHTDIRREVVEGVVREHGIEPIPQDFPQRARLTEHDIWTMQAVHDHVRTGALQEIHGLGETRIDRIVQAMGQMDFDILPASDAGAGDTGADDTDGDDTDEEVYPEDAFSDGAEDPAVPF